jgi:hypothetical protein
VGKGATLSTNQKVVIWARGKLGQKIGHGKCWDLGENALKQAGASTSNDLGPVGDDTDYVWGDPISDLSQIEPGDILQIRDHLVTTDIKIEYRFQDGSTVVETDERTAKRGHHTAIVNGKLDANGGVKTLEQHVKPRGDVVQDMYLYTRDVPAVTTKTIGQYKHPRTKQLERVSITKTVTVTVTGTIWPYHPKAK